MLSDQTFNVLVERFVRKPFKVPGPGSGIDAIRHAESLIEVAKEIAAEHPAAALEIAEYAMNCREVAAEWAVLQELVLTMLEKSIKASDKSSA